MSNIGELLIILGIVLLCMVIPIMGGGAWRYFNRK